MAKPKRGTKAGKTGAEAQAMNGADLPTRQVAATELHVVQVVEAKPAQPDLQKKELIERVIERSEIKRRDARPVVEAVLAILGETLAEGRGLRLEPLGKLRINRSEEKGNRRVVVAKLRQTLGGAEDAAEVEPDDEDSDGAPD